MSHLNVVKFPHNSLADLPQKLRDLADAIAPTPEAKEQRVFRIVYQRCIAHGVQPARAQIAATSAARAVRAGFEPSGAADRAVDRATRNNNDPGPFAA